ncbi:MAG: peptide MFS transporter [Candidatus Kapabacteria bacterium]|nr:peptide MFS transporter [Candidatus Kapabacteria bacterium]
MASMIVEQSSVASDVQEVTFFGHPRGLSVLFFTEFWERFSYYGMRAILLLFMTAPAAASGMGFDTATAGFIYGLYTSMAYLASVPGGWIADHLLGQRKAVFYGGILIAAGNFTLVLHGIQFLILGLLLIVMGTGLLKPNVSAIVGGLYSADEPARRDSGFSIFYMGINLGAFVAPLVVGSLGENVNWHLGFMASGIGMVIGLIWYRAGTPYLGDIGVITSHPEDLAKVKKVLLIASAGILGTFALAFIIHTSSLFVFTVDTVRNLFNVAYIVIPIVFFTVVFADKSLTTVEKKRFVVIAIFFLLSAIFWGSFEQAGTTFTIFARDYTDRQFFGAIIPVSYFQSLNALFIVIFASVFAWMWIKLGDRQPSSPLKFALGLILAGIGFWVLSTAAGMTAQGGKVSPLWLVSVYLIHTFGELCLSPVGLSNITKLAPARYVSQAMGIWFLGASLGNYIAGQAAGYIEHFPPSQLFFIIFCVVSGTGTLVALVSRPIASLMGGIK